MELALFLKDYGFIPDQVQDFYPTPGTLATCMYYTEKDPLTMKPVYVAKDLKEKKMQRALIHYNRPENRKTVIQALRRAGREDLIDVLLGENKGKKDEFNRRTGKDNRSRKKTVSKRKGKPLLLLEEIRGREGDLSNMVCRGDNKALMKTLIDEKQMAGSMQLIYIDPPFYSRTDYDAVVQAGREKIKHPAYGDRWEEGMAQYLKMLSGRLRLMRDLLSETGLIWLHLDWHVVHYAKVIMDEIFGEENFVNEIIWTYKSGGSGKRHFSRKHDTLLVYSKTKKYAFYPLKEKSYNRQFKPYRFKGVKEYRDDAGWYTLVNMKDVWQIDMVGRTSSERTGYATRSRNSFWSEFSVLYQRRGSLCRFLLRERDSACGCQPHEAPLYRLRYRKFGVESTVSRLAENGASFSVYDLDPPKASKIRVKIDWQEQEIPASDKSC